MTDWESVPLDSLCTVFDGPHATPKKTDRGAWFLSISSLVKGKLDLGLSSHISEEDFPRWARRVTPQNGDTLFSYETRIGESAFWDRNDRAVLGRRMGLLRPDRGRVDPRFLSLAYQSPSFQSEIRKRAIHGATVERIPIGEMGKWPILIPDLAEQRRIAGVLGALDDLIDTNEQLTTNLRENQRSAFRRLSDVPSEELIFGDLASLVRDRAGGDISTPYLGLEHFAENGAGIASHGRLGDTVSQQLAFSSGDVLYGKLRPYFRKVDRPWFDGACSAEIWVLRPKPGVPSSFLHSVVDSKEFTEFAMSGSEGTRMPRAKWDHVVNYPVALPTPNDLKRFESLGQRTWEALSSLNSENQQLRQTRDELLPLLMSGKIRVREAEELVKERVG